MKPAKLVSRQEFLMEKIGIAIEPRPTVFEMCDIDKSLLTLDFHQLLTTLNLTMVFNYSEQFNPRNGGYVIDESKIILKKQGFNLVKDGVDQMIYKEIRKLPSDFWQSDKLYKTEVNGKLLTVCEVKFFTKRMSPYPLWPNSKPEGIGSIGDAKPYWIQKILGRSFLKLNVLPVDESWLSREFMGAYGSFFD